MKNSKSDKQANKTIRNFAKTISNYNEIAEVGHYLNGDEVQWNGPEHLSWYRLINQLTEAECVTIIECVKSVPSPGGKGGPLFNDYTPAALYAVRTNAGRWARRDDVQPDYADGACAVLLRADALAHERQESRHGVLRMHIANKSQGVANGPWDSYIRVALGILTGY